jgi:dienelactone hydrolase
MRHAIIPLLALLVAACSSVGPETATVEDLSIPSMTPAVGRDWPDKPLFVAGKLTVASQPLNLPGELYLPKNAPTPMPAVVLVHGSGGLDYEGTHIREWAGRLNAWGVAALVIDTYGPRGITETVSDQQQISIFAQVADAYAALKQLAADPRIDRDHIAIMGFSRGAIVTVDTAFETLRQGFGGGNLHFAAHVALYSGCNVAFADHATDKAPMLFLHGEGDDFTPMAPCKEYATWLQSMGNAVTFVSYPGALHAFDSTMQVFNLPMAPTFGTCDARYDLGTARFVRVDHVDNPQMTADGMRKYFAGCGAKGASLGGDDKARADAFVQVHRFLTTTIHARADQPGLASR